MNCKYILQSVVKQLRNVFSSTIIREIKISKQSQQILLKSSKRLKTKIHFPNGIHSDKLMAIDSYGCIPTFYDVHCDD